nr:MAG TPA: hypothetical protein [Caudoviricetes sp.]
MLQQPVRLAYWQVNLPGMNFGLPSSNEDDGIISNETE